MNPLERIREKVRGLSKTIMLPESSDPRILRAASLVFREKLAGVVLIGRPDDVRVMAKKEGLDISGVQIVDHISEGRLEEYAGIYYENRKSKGGTEEEAYETMRKPLFYGAAMLKAGRVDGMVAGAANSTADVLRSVLRLIGTAPGIETISSSFVLVFPNPNVGYRGAFVFADCSVVPDPSASQLADIAMAAARTTRSVLGCEPFVAMLSYSTKGSAKSASVAKVAEATRILNQERKVDFAVDGEFQVDSAVVESVARLKAPGSPVGGKANVLVFPNLDAGNIGYKLAQRLAGAAAYGPLLQGVALPVSDLSRGCTAEEVVETVALTLARSE